MDRRTLFHFSCKGLLLAGFYFSTSTGTQASPGAWTQEKGHGQLIVSAAHYRAGKRFDRSGHERSQPTYTKQELNPYLEYGLTDSLTLGANLFLEHADDSASSRTALGDSQFFARYQLFRNEHYALAVQPLLKLPSPLRASRPAIGSREPDAAVSLIGGMNFNALGRSHFAEAESGYRYRFGTPGDQLQFAATLGLRATNRLIVMPQLFQTVRLGQPSGAFTLSPRDDYSLTKLQLSGVYALNDADSVQLGAFRHVAGENAGAGGGLLLSWWRAF